MLGARRRGCPGLKDARRPGAAQVIPSGRKRWNLDLLDLQPHPGILLGHPASPRLRGASSTCNWG